MTATVSPTIAPELGALIEGFERAYADAQGDPTRLPWCSGGPCPELINWLNAEAPSLIRPGARVCVVGCGLGDDAAALGDRGYDVTAFDVCEHAIEHARRRHPRDERSFMRADLLDLPARLRGRFDLVVEVHTLQSLPPDTWEQAAGSMASLLNHRGVLVAIAHGREDSQAPGSDDGPPFPLLPTELEAAMATAGLAPVRALDDFHDDGSPPVRRLRGLFHRPS